MHFKFDLVGDCWSDLDFVSSIIKCLRGHIIWCYWQSLRYTKNNYESYLIGIYRACFDAKEILDISRFKILNSFKFLRRLWRYGTLDFDLVYHPIYIYQIIWSFLVD